MITLDRLNNLLEKNHKDFVRDRLNDKTTIEILKERSVKFLSLPSGKIINIEKICLMVPSGESWWVHFSGDKPYPELFDSTDSKAILGKLFK
jgi:hypothetical protein